MTRTVERAAGHIRAVNPTTHDTDHVTRALARTAAMRNLHMLTSDPRRNPTLTLFAHPDHYLCAAGFQCPFTGSQVVENPAFAWNHGDIAPEINTTWLGPGRPRGEAYGRERRCEELDRGALPRGIGRC